MDQQVDQLIQHIRSSRDVGLPLAPREFDALVSALRCLERTDELASALYEVKRLAGDSSGPLDPEGRLPPIASRGASGSRVRILGRIADVVDRPPPATSPVPLGMRSSRRSRCRVAQGVPVSALSRRRARVRRSLSGWEQAQQQLRVLSSRDAMLQ